VRLATSLSHIAGAAVVDDGSSVGDNVAADCFCAADERFSRSTSRRERLRAGAAVAVGS